MHTGRQYRRILPPNWFENYDDYWRPAVQYDCLLHLVYSSLHVSTLPPFRLRPSDINSKEGYVEWAGQYDGIGHGLGVRMRFQIHKFTPYLEWSFRLVDNFGSFWQATIQVLKHFNFVASDREVRTIGTFDQGGVGLITDFSEPILYPVHYHDEH